MSGIIRGWIDSTVRKYSSLSQSRVLTTELNQAEIATIEGDRFNSQKVYSGFNTATPLYVLFENPVDSGVIVALQKRIFKTFTAGVSSFQILWDYDVSTATKTTIPAFNENNAFRATETNKFQVSVLNSVTVPSPDRGDWAITGAATVSNDGIERESDFISTSGVGVNTSGGIGSELGYRIYAPSTGFLVKVVSAANNNRIQLGYNWIEAPLSL